MRSDTDGAQAGKPTSRRSLNDYAAIGAALLGIGTIVLGVIMLFVFPSQAKLSSGFHTPIIAFEFAKSDADLAFLSGSDAVAEENRERMDAGHRWDAVFPYFYAGFIALLLFELIAAGQRWLWLVVPLALLIIPLDLRENAVLLAITETLRANGPTAALLAKLHTATWLKWGALGVCIAALSIGLAIQKTRSLSALSALTALAIGWCWLSDATPQSAEAVSAASFIFFLIFAITAIARAWRVISLRS